MKKILRNLLVLVIAMFPTGILAAGNIIVSPTSLTIEEGKTKTFTITATNAIGDVTISSSNSNVAKVSVNEWETGMVEEGQSKTVAVEVTGISEGSATITLTLDAATFDGEDLSGQTKTVAVTVRKISTNNNLYSLTVDNASVPNFNATTTSYTMNVDSETLSISAVAVDSKASVSGIGRKTLKYGRNVFEIKVTAESGSVKTYTLIINRNDNRDTNSNLSGLSVDKGSLSFNKNTLSYTVNVDSDIEKLTINATPESSKAKVDGVGIKNLKYGNNKFEIKVTAENETIKVYIVTVNRKDNRDTNNYLSELTVDKGNLEFNKNTTSYTLDVDSDVEKVTIKAVAENLKSKVAGDGEKTLKVGSNKFEIKVTAENETTKIYTIIINRKKDETVVEESYIKSLTIEGIDLNFDPAIHSYTISVSNQDALSFNYDLEEGVTASIEGNENLQNNSIITLKLTKGADTKEYTFTVYKQEESKDEVVTAIGKKDNKKNNWIIFAIIGAILLGIIGFVTNKKSSNKKKVNEPSVVSSSDISEMLTSDTITQTNTNNEQNNDIEKLNL